MKTIHLQNDDTTPMPSSTNNQIKNVFTTEVLKTFPNCENYTDEELQNIVETFEKLSEIVYELNLPEKINVIDNQQVIYLNSQKQNNNNHHLKAA